MTTPTPRERSSQIVVVALLALVASAAAVRPASAQMLFLNPTTITFPSSDPDTVPVIAAAPIRVTYLILPQGNQAWTMTIRANGPLTAGSQTIPISNVTWVATPNPPFRDGTLSTVAQTLATGTGIEVLQRGDVTFRFTNSWNYTVGNYTQTITFTLSSP